MGNTRKVQGIYKAVTIRQLSAVQTNKCAKKGCQLSAIHVIDDSVEYKPRLEDYPVLQEFRDVFPYKVPGLPPKRDIYFTIELVPGGSTSVESTLQNEHP